MLKRTIFLLLILFLIGLSIPAAAQETNRAGLVVVLEDGTAVTRCVEFAEDEINGLELLNRSGLAVEMGTESLGVLVCRIEETGCPGSDCFCQCKGGDCVYWSYWHLKDEGWQYSQAGGSVHQIKDGMVDGWSWGPGTPQEAPQPPLLTIDEICAAPVEGAVPEPVTVTKIAEAATAVSPPTPESTTNGPPQWLGYGLLGLIVIGLGGLLLVRGRKGPG